MYFKYCSYSLNGYIHCTIVFLQGYAWLSRYGQMDDYFLWKRAKYCYLKIFKKKTIIKLFKVNVIFT